MNIISPIDTLNLEPSEEIQLAFQSKLDEYAYKYEVDTKFYEGGDKPKVGFIYIFYSLHGTKIGLTRDPSGRFKKIQSYLPFQLTPIAIIPVADMPTREITLHNRFAEKRIKGEWFKLDSKDISWLINLMPSDFRHPLLLEEVDDNNVADVPF